MLLLALLIKRIRVMLREAKPSGVSLERVRPFALFRDAVHECLISDSINWEPIARKSAIRTYVYSTFLIWLSYMEHCSNI